MKVLVTGATKGIGRAISARMAADGHEVVGLARSATPDFPGQLIACDMGSETDLAVSLEALREAAIDAVVNNAGFNIAQSVEDVRLSDFWAIQELNVRAPLQIVKTLAPGMKARKFGRIVNISSRAQLGIANHSAYAASKAALSAMGRCWALELAPFGITVNGVAPGPIDTELFHRTMPPESKATQGYLGSIPVQRIGQPDEIASAVTYLLSRDAGFITGQTIYACGGLTVGRALNA